MPTETAPGAPAPSPTQALALHVAHAQPRGWTVPELVPPPAAAGEAAGSEAAGGSGGGDGLGDPEGRRLVLEVGRGRMMVTPHDVTLCLARVARPPPSRMTPVSSLAGP
jgi:hypothetical protein